MTFMNKKSRKKELCRSNDLSFCNSQTYSTKLRLFLL